MRVLALAVIFLGSCGSLASVEEECRRANAQLVEFKKGSREILEQGKVLVENTRVLPAIRRVLERYQALGISPPPFEMLRPDSSKDATWTQFARSLAEIPRYGDSKSIEWRKMKAGTDPVYELTLEGRRSVFRAVGEYQDLRLSLAAAKLNQFLGLKTVPAQRFAVVNGKLGLVSDFVEGITLPNLNQTKPLQRLREAGSLNDHSHSDAIAFEFLVGNNDAKKADTIVATDGRVICVDHNYAFTRGLTQYFPAEGTLGMQLPEKYTRGFVAAIAPLRRDGGNLEQRRQFVETLSPHLTDAEIEATLFRLDVIQADLDARGASALY
jgi:hypothetical protein